MFEDISKSRVSEEDCKYKKESYQPTRKEEFKRVLPKINMGLSTYRTYKEYIIKAKKIELCADRF